MAIRPAGTFAAMGHLPFSRRGGNRLGAFERNRRVPDQGLNIAGTENGLPGNDYSRPDNI